MALDSINDGMGKKIVEALKMQTAEHSEGEVFVNDNPQDIVETPLQLETEIIESVPGIEAESSPNVSYDAPQQHMSDMQIKIQSQLQEKTQQEQIRTMVSPSFIDSAFQQSIARNLSSTSMDAIPDDFDYPANVAVLKQLIAKLPAGVSKQTGALIIKQTMEALGISMGSVLQEAKQVQEALNNSSKDCQNTIIDYRKQIGILEIKAKQYQKQSIIMNDIINLFIQTSK